MPELLAAHRVRAPKLLLFRGLRESRVPDPVRATYQDGQVQTIYLAPSQPRVPLSSEAELQQAIEGGLLVESHFLDLKREVKATKGENRELARDLASFAVDGGTLLVGVDEGEGGRLSLAPQPLAQLAEKVEQVAAMIPDPPLGVVTQPILSAEDSTRGYLVVHVPASPAAPHMVDSRYVGRGDKTKRYLTDAEVLRLHQLRANALNDAAALLRAEIDRDPVPIAERRQAHLFLLAEPLAGRPEMALHLTDGEGWQQRLLTFTHTWGRSRQLQAVLGSVKAGGFSPDLDAMTTFRRRPGGAALTTSGLLEDRTVARDAYGLESLAELEVREDGGLRLFTSRLSYRNASAPPALKEHLLMEIAAVTFVRRLIALTLGVAEEAGYFGNWHLACGVTGLRGAYSFTQSRQWAAEGSRYSEDGYQRAHLVTYADLRNRPGWIADRLVGALLRAFGTRGAFSPALSDPAPTPDQGRR